MTNSTLKAIFCALSFMIFAHFSHAQCATKYDTISPTICAGDTFFFNGIPHTRSTQIGGPRPVTDTVVLAGGCDSITFLRLTVLRAARDSFNQSICTGTSYQFFGQTLRSTGVYRDTLFAGSAYGCDSFVIINLTVGGAVTSSASATVCRGDSALFNGVYYGTAGVYNDTIVSGTACDSIVVFTLRNYPTPTTTINQPYCAGTPYVFNGVTLTTPGTYRDTLHGVSRYGCDSIVRLNFFPTVIRANRRDTICYADTLFIPGGYYILGSNGSGRYAPDTVAFGCIDTAYVYTIVVDSPATPMISASGLMLSQTVAGFTSFDWMMGGSSVGTQPTYTASMNGSYTVLATDARGCSAVSAPYTVTGVGISETATYLSTNVYPNPNAGTCQLTSNDAIGAEAVIYDLLGKVAARFTVTEDNMSLHLGLSEGIYMLKLKDNGGRMHEVSFTIAK
jgi:hypothetical protein